MKKERFFTALGAVLLVLAAAGCASTKVTRVDADKQIDLSGRWNDTDVRLVCETLIAQCLTSPLVDNYVSDFAAKNKGRLPTVIVGRFKNSSSEHIDTTIISRSMEVAIVNSGKLDFVAGGEEREDLRAERQDQQLNASEATAARLGNETGANFMLTGEVNSVVDSVDGRQVRAYFVSATLTDVETNRRLWMGEDNSIKKDIRQAKAKL